MNADLAAQVDALEDNSQVCVTLAGGRQVVGRFARAHGVPFVQGGGETIVLRGDDLETVDALEVVKSAALVIAERDARRFGELAYKQPTTRAEYAATLWDLARQIAQLTVPSYSGQDATLALFRRGQQLKAQFDLVADQVELAKAKRRYLLVNGGRHADGRPLITISELVPLGTANGFKVSVPKPTDFDPDPVVRRKRSPRPPEDYYSRADLEWSLSDARAKAARCSARRRREMLERIVAERTRQLAAGEYYEAQLERQKGAAAA